MMTIREYCTSLQRLKKQTWCLFLLCSYLTIHKLLVCYYHLLSPSTPNPISVNKSLFCKVSVKLSHGWRRLPLFMDEYRQVLAVNSKLMIYVFTELGATGIPKGLLACNAPLGVVATATPNKKTNSKL